MAADLIFTGGRIYTVLPDERRMVPATAGGEAASSQDTSSGAGIGTADGPPATAVAVHGGRIVAVGEPQDLLVLIRQIDVLIDKTVRTNDVLGRG